jgi:hypothetical protein
LSKPLKRKQKRQELHSKIRASIFTGYTYQKLKTSKERSAVRIPAGKAWTFQSRKRV